jgi:hypothetical protein
MKAISSKGRWTFDAEGHWLCLKMDGAQARQIVDKMQEGKQYDLEIKLHRNRRSLDANAYFWVLLDQLATETKMEKTHLYREMVKEIGGNSQVICVTNEGLMQLKESWERNGPGWVAETFPSKLEGCTNMILYYGSSTYDTAQMSRLIALVVQECRQVGIETMTPRELSLLMEAWDAKKNKKTGHSHAGKGQRVSPG